VGRPLFSEVHWPLALQPLVSPGKVDSSASPESNSPACVRIGPTVPLPG
jgi:hypothetical protein